MYYKILGLLVCSSFIGCSTPNIDPQSKKSIVYDSGFSSFNVSKFDKSEKLFFQNSKYYVSKYSYAVVSSKKTINIRIPSSSMQKSVYLYTPEDRGYIAYCDYKKDDPNLNVFKIFLKWESQSEKKREATKDQTNKLIANFKCNKSSVPKSKPDWYVEIEKSSQQPVLVSNANWVLFINPLKNRTIALTKDDIDYLLNELDKYFKE